MGIQCKKVRQNVNYNNVCDGKLLSSNVQNDEVTPAGNITETNRFRCQHADEQCRSLRSLQPTPSSTPQPRSLTAKASPLRTKSATKCVQNGQTKLQLAQQQQQQQQLHKNQCDRNHHIDDKERKIKSKKVPLSSSVKITIANKIISRFTQLISFNQDHKSLASSYTNAVTIAPPTINNKVNNKNNHHLNSDNNNLDRIESANTNDRNNSTKHKYNTNNNNNNVNNTHSQYFIRQSLSLYAASGFLLALCYLVYPVTAAAGAPPASIDTPHLM